VTAKYYQFKESFSRNGILNNGTLSVERETLGGKKFPSKWVANPNGGNTNITVQNGYASLSAAGGSAWVESDNGLADALSDANSLKKYGKGIMNALYNSSTHYDYTFSPGIGLVTPAGIYGNVYISLGKYFSKAALYEGLTSTEVDTDFFDFFAAQAFSYSLGGATYVQNGIIAPSLDFYTWYWLWFDPSSLSSLPAVSIGGPDRFIGFQTTSLQAWVKNTKDKNDNAYTFYGTGIVRFYEDVNTILKSSLDFITTPKSLKFIDNISAKNKPIKTLVRNVQYNVLDYGNAFEFNPVLIEKIENISISNTLNSKFSRTIKIPHGKTSISTNLFTGIQMGSYLNVSPKIYDLNFWQGPATGWSVGRI
jgi:hypothetical protein